MYTGSASGLLRLEVGDLGRSAASLAASCFISVR